MTPRNTALNRRLLLQGMGAAVALPWLESGHLLGTEKEVTPPRRFGCLFWGDGIHPAEWWSKGDGAEMELGPAFESLEEVKQKVNFFHGLQHPGSVCGGHAKGAAGILTGIQPQGGRTIRAATSLDQLIAGNMGDETALSSLVLACERPVSGFHESGYSMMYSSHVSWSSPVSPVPAELYPSLAFDSLFESRGSKTAASVLDHVLGQLGDVTRKVSKSDQASIEEYTTSVREVERRLVRLQERGLDETTDPTVLKGLRPADGLPNQIDEHSRLMCDIIALAFQTDRTRVATLLLTNNLSGQVYPFLGLNVDHHNYSHGWKNSEFAAITRFWVSQYAYLVKKLNSMQEGSGTVLDNTCLMMANEQWTAHSAPRVPLIMAGGLSGQLKTGRSVDFESAKERRMSSLYMTLLERMGMPQADFGNSDEQLSV